MPIHENQPVLSYGKPLAEAAAAMIMIHGRGASAESILSLAAEFPHPDYVYLAPQAAGYQWYPYPFMQPIATNEPYLTSALGVITTLIAQVNEAGISTDKIILLGFSQGACLSLEYAARNTARYKGVVGLSGGLIGPDGTPRDYPGSFDSTPIFLGCSDVDAHIPLRRVEESAEVMARLGAAVTKRIYPGMGHTVNQDEIDFIKGLM